MTDTPAPNRPGRPRKQGAAATPTERTQAWREANRVQTVQLPGDILDLLDAQVRQPAETRVAALSRLVRDAAR